ncbi:hypothetical protein PROH_04535 [Prochlorothrix hollandica PCC 9006 = CALU 1027]|uniref:Uncharacterized protein n=1 Tax=Prochlorothrix hollandica PCC 9006 = CALU 1027 TaxID=317619 RepID=A0A0M2PZH9_PROHO|nr:hypothetical protein PROH_04535 [Prochlorothrix hollandica PCC 9006 = CALU 1027]
MHATDDRIVQIAKYFRLRLRLVQQSQVSCKVFLGGLIIFPRMISIHFEFWKLEDLIMSYKFKKPLNNFKIGTQHPIFSYKALSLEPNIFYWVLVWIVRRK